MSLIAKKSIFMQTLIKMIIQWIQRVPILCRFWDLKKPCYAKFALSSGTVGGPLLTLKSPTCAYKSQILVKWRPH